MSSKKTSFKEHKYANGNNGNDDNSDINDDNSDNNNVMKQFYPQIMYPTLSRKTYINCPPNGTQWVHEQQEDDEWTDVEIKRAKKVKELNKIENPEQRTAKWFAQRECGITGSDGGATVGVNDYEPQYNVIKKKIIKIPFSGKKACYHGKKFEHPANMIYEYRMNVKVRDYGLMRHPKYEFLGASPDGIVGAYKLDGIHKTKYVGRMIEIKVPESRVIDMTSADNSKFKIFPEYYWVQVQLQLECCDLDECDAWQCTINEYKNREAFIKDTMIEEPFRSKSTGFEKGCLIQLLPNNAINSDYSNFYDVLYDQTAFIYPPKIEMTPLECDLWIAQTMATYKENEKYRNYSIDRVVYWKLVRSRCLLIKRDKKWFADHLDEYREMWEIIAFLREHPKQKQMFLDYIDYAEECIRKSERNSSVMETVKSLCNIESKHYEKKLSKIEKLLATFKKNKKIKNIKLVTDYISSLALCDSDMKNNTFLQEVLEVLKDPLNKKYDNLLDKVDKEMVIFNRQQEDKLGVDEVYDICE